MRNWAASIMRAAAGSGAISTTAIESPASRLNGNGYKDDAVIQTKSSVIECSLTYELKLSDEMQCMKE